MSRDTIASVLLGGFLLLTAPAWGQGRDIHPATPSYEGTTGLFHMPTADTLPRGRLSFGLFRDNLHRDPKDEDISIYGLSLGFGATRRLELHGNIGVQNRVDADALFQPGRMNDYPFVATPSETGFGDVRLGAKFRLLGDSQGDAVGLAARAFVKLPTADDAKGLGTGKISFGIDFILSKSVGEKLDLHGSVGFQHNNEPETLDLGSPIKVAGGLNVSAYSWLAGQAELMWTRYAGYDESGTQLIGPQTNPLDLVIGPVLGIKPGFFIRPAASWNLNFDDRGLDQGSRSRTGLHISIGYHPGPRRSRQRSFAGVFDSER